MVMKANRIFQLEYDFKKSYETKWNKILDRELGNNFTDSCRFWLQFCKYLLHIVPKYRINVNI